MKVNRENLTKLLQYLETLPADYDNFDMGSYLSRDYKPRPEEENNYVLYHENVVKFEKAARSYVLCEAGLPECGTIACLAGHGPAAGICFKPEHVNQYGEQWSSYVADNFFNTKLPWAALDSIEYRWLFHAYWRTFDNTLKGGMARIRYYLADQPIPDYYSDDSVFFDPELYKEYVK